MTWSEKLWKIGKSAMIAGAGAALTVVGAWATNNPELGYWGPVVGGAVAWAVNALNVLRQPTVPE